ncbi:MAG: non-canonical purine NTP diphosphatase [Bacteroidales bacterium]
MDIVFATNNAHKLEELREIVGDRINILSLNDIDCHEEIVEDADTLEGNALIKARFVKERYGYDCFADDTGLEIVALDGAPGVYSARYAGEQCNAEDNIDRVLRELEGVENRSAKFRTVIALILGGEELLFSGEVDGVILTERDGIKGFGYDPIFMPVESGVSFASMSAESKNAISHRGRATAKLMEYLANK